MEKINLSVKDIGIRGFNKGIENVIAKGVTFAVLAAGGAIVKLSVNTYSKITDKISAIKAESKVKASSKKKPGSKTNTSVKEDTPVAEAS